VGFGFLGLKLSFFKKGRPTCWVLGFSWV